jgi:lipopolysaccharide transport protein LptA
MTRRLLVISLTLTVCAASMHAQTPAPAQPAPAAGTQAPAATKPGGPPKPGEAITTEIYADEAAFDSSKNIGVFSGHVRVNDPRFNIQSDKLTVYISKGENQGLERAVAEGNVGVVRDRPEPNGKPPQRSISRSEKAVYTAGNENVELTGNPRVQEGMNTHVATSTSTVMILNQNGQLTTHGPSRTEIRQEAKKDAAKEAPKQ